MRSFAKYLLRHLLGRAWSAAALVRLLGAMLAAPASTGLPRLALRVAFAVTKRLKLFDRAYYLVQSPAPRPGVAPRDCVAQGEAAGRRPAPLIDPQYYRSQIDEHVPGRTLNAVLHYGLWGRFHGISLSPWFDVGYQFRGNGDVAAAGIDPLLHFARCGWREGRKPMPGLDMRVVLRDHPGLRVSKSNPLVHLLQEFGRAKAHPLAGSAARAGDDERTQCAAVVAGHLGRPRAAPRRGVDAPAVDVVVPVYCGNGGTLRCLWSVLAAPVTTPFEHIVIDDAGPDPVLSAMLDDLTTRGLFTLRRSAVNLGFVATVNHGLRLHPERTEIEVDRGLAPVTTRRAPWGAVRAGLCQASQKRPRRPRARRCPPWAMCGASRSAGPGSARAAPFAN